MEELCSVRYLNDYMENELRLLLEFVLCSLFSPLWWEVMISLHVNVFLLYSIMISLKGLKEALYDPGEP